MRCTKFFIYLKILTGSFTFSGPCIVMYLRNKDQQNALFLLIYSNESVLYMFRIE